MIGDGAGAVRDVRAGAGLEDHHHRAVEGPGVPGAIQGTNRIFSLGFRRKPFISAPSFSGTYYFELI